MGDSSVQQKIELLIRQLEEEINRLSTVHEFEMRQLKERSQADVRVLKTQFDLQISDVDVKYKAKIFKLEEEINYLKEVNSSQRCMMEDTLLYIKELEGKLLSLPDSST